MFDESFGDWFAKLNSIARARRHVLRLILGMAIVVFAAPVVLGQNDFLVTLRDGNVLRTGLQLTSMPWHRVESQGVVVTEELRMDSIAKLELARTPASRQLMDIRQNLADLQSDNYHVRNDAEAGLMKWGGQFIDVLTAARESGNAEVRYRVGRVLKRLQSKEAKRIDADFDVATLTNGEVVSGDLEFDAIEVNYKGQKWSLHRDAIHQIERAPSLDADSSRKDWTTQAFSKAAEPFYENGDTHITFDAGRLNESFAKFEMIPLAYVYRGARLTADCGADPATIVTAGFAIDQSRSKKNSAATMMSRNTKKYLGSIQVDFCQPGLANVPATVHRVGCFIALVDHPRDFVLDAFSSDHQIVATAEALEKSAFMGVESSIPIAYVRIQPNRNLKVDPAEQDPNFVIDDLTFDTPQPAYGPCVDRSVLVGVDGSRLLCSSLEFDGQSFVAKCSSELGSNPSPEPIAFAPDEVASIAFNVPSAPPSDQRAGALWGYFRDGSMFPLEIQATQWNVGGYREWVVAKADLAGIWGGAKVLRFPFTEDLSAGKTVVVNPAERWIIPEIRIGSDGVSFAAETAELREPVKLEESTHTPDSTSQFSLSDAPSIWWSAPIGGEASAGWLRTVDGRRFSLNGSAQIQLVNFERDAVVLSHDKSTIRIPWNEVVALKMPTKQ